ncbi:MAG: hypothetical protein PVG35_17220 [Desulfobacterales bacterium]|jgi:hypothetical protein
MGTKTDRIEFDSIENFQTQNSTIPLFHHSNPDEVPITAIL